MGARDVGFFAALSDSVVSALGLAYMTRGVIGTRSLTATTKYEGMCPAGNGSLTTGGLHVGGTFLSVLSQTWTGEEAT
jgi:hypothetical protein